jgi:pantoate--beta-alanine ligase
MSSRNVRLDSDARIAADVISKVLRAATECDSVDQARKQLIVLEDNLDFKLDYAEIIDETSFELANNETQQARAIVAGWIDGVRLIDNMAMKKALVRV